MFDADQLLDGGGLVFGSGKSSASCPGTNYEVNGFDIQNLQ